MPSAFLLATWLASGAGGLAPALAEPFATPPAALAPPLARQQDPAQTRAPVGWIALGIAAGSLEIDEPGLGDPDDGSLYGGDIGFYRWRGEMGLAVEAGFYASSFETRIDALTVDEVDTRRYMLGVRAADRGISSHYVPWLRAGFLYRTDEGEVVDDDGAGFYVGGGLDWGLTERLSLTPQFMFMDSSSLDSQEWVGGLALTFYL